MVDDGAERKVGLADRLVAWSTANELRRWSVMFVLVAIIVVAMIMSSAPMFAKVALLVIVGFLALVSKGARPVTG